MSEAMQMNCSEVLGELPLHVGGDLESPLAERVDQHLSSCGSCRVAMDEAQDARTARLEHFELAASEAPTTSLWPALREQLRSEGLLQGGAPEPRLESVTLEPRPTQRGRLLRFLPMGAAAAGLFYLGTLTQRGLTPGEFSGPGLSSPEVVDVAPASEASPLAVELPGGNQPLQPVRQMSGTPLRPVNSVDEYLERRAAPFFGDALPAFNAFQSGQDLNSAAGFRGGGPGARRDGLR